jgi:hypothetical protein
MALGDQGKALRILSQARGWDPTVIPARGGKPEVNIGNFDMAPSRPGDGDHCVGKLPEGVPDSYPQAETPRYDEITTKNDVPWNAPELRSNVNRATKNGKQL